MTINQYLKEITEKEPALFEEFCVDELNSDKETIQKIINQRCISFDLAIKILDYMGITCYLTNDENEDTIRMKSVSFPIELERIHGKEQQRYFEFETFADDYLDFSGKARDIVSREQVYSLYLKYCTDNSLKPMSRQLLYRFLRDTIYLINTSLNVEFWREKTRFFRGIIIKEN